MRERIESKHVTKEIKSQVFMNPSINALTKLVDKRKNTDIAEFVEEGEI